MHFFPVPVSFLHKVPVSTLVKRVILSQYSQRPLSTITVDSVPGKESKESQGKWSGKNAWKLGALTITCAGAFCIGSIICIWGPPGYDEHGTKVVDRFSDMPLLKGYFLRSWQTFIDFNKSIKDPVSDKLLPDPVEPPYYQPPYTLVMEINDVLVHPDWKFRTGWRFKKRPCLELFLQQLSPFFEVVTFTSESAMTGMPVLAQLDPKGQYIHYRLFREATRYCQGKHIKDLSCLNRDLSRVIMIDWSPEAGSMQPRNTLLVHRWNGSDADRELIDLAAFLRMIGMSGVDDIRPVLDHYREFDDPLSAFKEKHEQLMEAQSRKKEEFEKAASKSKSRFGSLSFPGIGRS